ncbi:hypothetical protein [Agromyces aerolatus]|uniref:hypothetical protein n=1 Tax=Agromyces sp. LY-1074 TaxID=3074080 RepID=UPI00285CBD07|nr:MULTISPECIES: hypothetical protein [unclassified Agromyces]MDR5700303.1 hypothetical protein [Agromyces sp. LY-1074]MDR5706719.1 hypothetical protein [Agromyces sp. LY-1358]
MNRTIRRTVTGLCAALVGATVFAAATPANAADSAFEAPDGQIRSVVERGAIFPTPRAVSPIGEVAPGTSVEAYCGFVNEGAEWVKINQGGTFGFIRSSALDTRTHGLPATCPSEVETVRIPTFGFDFQPTQSFVPVPEFRCPATYPFLRDFKAHDTLERITPGVTVQRAEGEGIVVDTGLPIYDTSDAWRIIGYTGGSMSNYGGTQSAGLIASCTSNPEKAATFW